MKLTVDVFLTADKMPEPNRVVIINGGIASWTGGHWVSRTWNASGRLIYWAVKWWAPLIRDNDVLATMNASWANEDAE